MAKFCSDECKQQGSICDFCIHYADQYRDIEGKECEFAGYGICKISNEEVEANEGYHCNDFECCEIKT